MQYNQEIGVFEFQIRSRMFSSSSSPTVSTMLTWTLPLPFSVQVTGIFRAVPVRINPRARNVRSVYRTFIDVIHFRRQKSFTVDGTLGEEATNDDEESMSVVSICAFFIPRFSVLLVRRNFPKNVWHNFVIYLTVLTFTSCCRMQSVGFSPDLE